MPLHSSETCATTKKTLPPVADLTHWFGLIDFCSVMAHKSTARPFGPPDTGYPLSAKGACHEQPFRSGIMGGEWFASLHPCILATRKPIFASGAVPTVQERKASESISARAPWHLETGATVRK